MDIYKWLDETVHPGPHPSLTEKFGSRHPTRAEDSRPVTKEKRKEKGRRRRSTSDSSLLTPRPQQENHPPANRRINVEKSTNERIPSSDASQSIRSRSSASTSSSQLYARRPRRKTRPERYEPSSNSIKERGAHTRQHRQGESKKTQRKSRRKKARKPGSGFVQSFRAKNVPRDRLTLKPREKLGIFSKGRASSPVRGRGLPDLVFSEMKFLHRDRAQPASGSQITPPKKRRKADYPRANEEDISAYFTSVRPVLAEKNLNTQRKEHSHKNQEVLWANLIQHEHSSVADRVRSTVEGCGQVSLRGAQKKRPQGGSISYISWSESIRNSSTTPRHVQALPGINNGQLDLAHRGGERENTNGGDLLRLRSGSYPVSRDKTNGQREGSQISSLGPEHHRASPSHSFPYSTSPSPPEGVPSEVEKSRSLDKTVFPLSFPPAAPVPMQTLDERTQSVETCEDLCLRIGHVVGHDGEDIRDKATKTNKIEDVNEVDQRPSSSLERLLQVCNATFHEERRAGPLNAANIDPARLSQRAGDRRIMVDTRPDYTLQYVPAVRSSGREVLRHPAATVSVGASIYQWQAQQRQIPLETILDEALVIEGSHSMDSGGKIMETDEGVMSMYMDQEEAYAWDEELHEWPELRAYEETEEAAAHDGEEPCRVFRAGQINEQTWTERHVVGSRFWRPHKLY